MNRYSENFTLKDIFNCKELEGILPLVNYKEYNVITPEGSSVIKKTNMKSVKKQIFDASIKMAHFYYRPLKAVKSGDTLVLDGNLIGDQDACVNDIYDNLVGLRPLLIFTANNGDIIRTALRESEKNTRKYGLNSKLFLRQQSLLQIKGMTYRQRVQFMNDVMSNILFGDNYPATQKKYKGSELDFGNQTYDQMRDAWRRKVGI